MPRNFLMPKLGLTMTEGSVAEWLVQPGQRFTVGQVYVTVETDKVANEIEAPEAGVLTRILVEAGETVDVGVPIAEWEPDAPAQHAASSSPSASASSASAPPLKSAPAAQRHAATAAQITAARRLVESKRNIPHFYLSTEIEVSQLSQQRAAWNATPGAPKATVSHVFIAAMIRVLENHPELNRVWDDDGIFEPAGIDIGIAVDTDKGLMVPVLRNAAGRNLRELIGAVDDLVSRARSGALRADDVGGGVVTLSNAGMHDVTTMTSIIPLGQSAIFGVGSVREVFRPDASGAPLLKREMGVVLSCDHRVLDGVLGLKLLNGVRALLEQPAALLSDVGKE